MKGISERNLALVKWRDGGGSLAELARSLLITNGRAYQIYRQTKERLARESQNGDAVPDSRLSVRARNCLTNAGMGDATREQVRLWLIGAPGDLLKVKNVGRKTAAEIREWAGEDIDE